MQMSAGVRRVSANWAKPIPQFCFKPLGIGLVFKAGDEVSRAVESHRRGSQNRTSDSRLIRLPLSGRAPAKAPSVLSFAAIPWAMLRRPAVFAR
jgi:hypothetical protein